MALPEGVDPDGLLITDIRVTVQSRPPRCSCPSRVQVASAHQWISAPHQGSQPLTDSQGESVHGSSFIERPTPLIPPDEPAKP